MKLQNLKDLHSLALEEKNEEILNECSLKINNLLILVKKLR